MEAAKSMQWIGTCHRVIALYSSKVFTFIVSIKEF